MNFTDERRIYDSRHNDDKQPSTLFAVQTGLDPNTVAGVMVNVTVIGISAPGYMGTNGGTSFNNFKPGEVIDNARPFRLQPDGTIHMGATAPVHVIVDLIGYYPRA